MYCRKKGWVRDLVDFPYFLSSSISTFLVVELTSIFDFPSYTESIRCCYPQDYWLGFLIRLSGCVGVRRDLFRVQSGCLRLGHKVLVDVLSHTRDPVRLGFLSFPPLFGLTSSGRWIRVWWSWRTPSEFGQPFLSGIHNGIIHRNPRFSKGVIHRSDRYVDEPTDTLPLEWFRLKFVPWISLFHKSIRSTRGETSTFDVV